MLRLIRRSVLAAATVSLAATAAPAFANAPAAAVVQRTVSNEVQVDYSAWTTDPASGAPAQTMVDVTAYVEGGVPHVSGHLNTYVCAPYYVTGVSLDGCVYFDRVFSGTPQVYSTSKDGTSATLSAMLPTTLDGSAAAPVTIALTWTATGNSPTYSSKDKGYNNIQHVSGTYNQPATVVGAVDGLSPADDPNAYAQMSVGTITIIDTLNVRKL